MKFSMLGRLAGAAGLMMMLAGCFDISMDVQVLSETGGKATVTTTMGADIYPMVKQSAGQGGDSDFCKEAGPVLTENADCSATCD